MSDVAINVVAITISTFSVILTIYMIMLSYKEIVNRKARNIFLFVLYIQILQQICVTTTYQIFFLNALDILVLLLILITCFCQVAIVVNVLQIFSVLDSRITPNRLKLFKTVTVVIFALLTAPTVIYLFLVIIEEWDSEFFTFIENIFQIAGIAVAVITVLLDQISTLYVTVLIFKNGKAMRKYKQMVKSIIFLAIQLLLDYFTIGLEVYQLNDNGGEVSLPIPSLSGDLIQIIVSTTTMHVSLSVYTFYLFKELFIAGKIEDEITSKSKKSAPVMLLDAIRKEEGRAVIAKKVVTDQYPKTVIIGA